MAEIRRRFGKTEANMLSHEYIAPIVSEAPRKAFYADKVSVPLDEAAGKVCTEFVMCYPPGIPILAPGELITPEIIEYIKYAKEKGCQMTGTEDLELEHLNVMT
jgi:arginine/lysine/ornithine decarboxylase